MSELRFEEVAINYEYQLMPAKLAKVTLVGDRETIAEALARLEILPRTALSWLEKRVEAGDVTDASVKRHVITAPMDLGEHDDHT